MLVFQLTTPVVTVVEDAPPAPARVINSHVDFDTISRLTLAKHLSSREPLRAVTRQIEQVNEQLWLTYLRPTWDAFANRLRAMGYDFQHCFFEEESLDIRDSQQKVHIGLSAIASAVVEDARATHGTDTPGTL